MVFCRASRDCSARGMTRAEGMPDRGGGEGCRSLPDTEEPRCAGSLALGVSGGIDGLLPGRQAVLLDSAVRNENRLLSGSGIEDPAFSCRTLFLMMVMGPGEVLLLAEVLRPLALEACLREVPSSEAGGDKSFSARSSRCWCATRSRLNGSVGLNGIVELSPCTVRPASTAFWPAGSRALETSPRNGWLLLVGSGGGMGSSADRLRRSPELGLVIEACLSASFWESLCTGRSPELPKIGSRPASKRCAEVLSGFTGGHKASLPAAASASASRSSSSSTPRRSL